MGEVACSARYKVVSDDTGVGMTKKIRLSPACKGQGGVTKVKIVNPFNAFN